MSWPTTTFRGVDYWMYDGITLVPIDPTTGAAYILLKPANGAITDGIPPIADGADGVPPALDSVIDVTELAYDDPTAASGELTLISPGPPPVYGMSLALHAGAPGDDTVTSIDMGSIAGTATASKIIKVNATADGFDYAYEAVGERYIPATINNTSAGNPTSTLATVSIPARNRDYRPLVSGYTVVTQSGGSDVVTDLIVRLNNETGGNIVGRCPGVTSTERLMLASGPAAGSADSFDKVTAGNAATFYFRTERQSGTNTYTTSSSTTRFCVWAMPIG